jgi:hypothetical protein
VAGCRLSAGPARWFDCGLIDCIALSWATKVRSDEVVHYEYDADWRARATEDGQYLVLARDDAGALLSDPSTWRADGIGAGVMLCESNQADGLSFDAWFGKLAGLPDQLIYEHPLWTGYPTGRPRRRWPNGKKFSLHGCGHLPLGTLRRTACPSFARSTETPISRSIGNRPMERQPPVSPSMTSSASSIEARLGEDSGSHSDVTVFGAPAVVQSGTSSLLAVLAEQPSAMPRPGRGTVSATGPVAVPARLPRSRSEDRA